MAAITLIEYAKGIKDDWLRAVVETFASGSPVLGKLAFMDIKAGAIEYLQEETLPGIAFRNLNATYTASSGVLNPLVEKVKILGGSIDTDIAFIRRFGEERRKLDIEQKAKAAARYFDAMFIDGDESTYPTQFYGLNKRLVSPQLMYADGAGSAGAVLSENILDRLIDGLDEKPDLLLMGKAMARQLKYVFKSSTIISTDKNQWGEKVLFYDGIEIGILDKDNLNNVILDIDETVGSDTCGSIYALKFGENRLIGIQTAPPDLKDLGEITVGKLTYRMDWDVGIAMFHPRCAARMAGIKKTSGVI